MYLREVKGRMKKKQETFKLRSSSQAWEPTKKTVRRFLIYYKRGYGPLRAFSASSVHAACAGGLEGWRWGGTPVAMTEKARGDRPQAQSRPQSIRRRSVPSSSRLPNIRQRMVERVKASSTESCGRSER